MPSHKASQNTSMEDPSRIDMQTLAAYPETLSRIPNEAILSVSFSLSVLTKHTQNYIFNRSTASILATNMQIGCFNRQNASHSL